MRIFKNSFDGSETVANKEAGAVFDDDTGIVMIHLRKRRRGEKHKRGGGQLYTEEVVPGWIVDFDGEGKPIEFEILNPSKHFPKEILALLPKEFIPAPQKEIDKREAYNARRRMQRQRARFNKTVKAKAPRKY